MKTYLILAISAALLFSAAGCASDSPSSGGSIAPSGSSTGSLGSGNR